MRKDLIDHSRWLSRTSVLGRIRSAQLKAIDDALKAYEISGSEADLSKIRVALAAWKAKEGAGWKISKRNANGALTELDKRLDAAPVESFYTRDLAHSRMGLLYLFSRMKVEHGWFKVAIESGFEVAGAAVGFNPAQDAMGSTASALTGGGVGAGAFLSSQAFEMAPAPPRTVPQGFLQQVLAALQDFARRVWAHIKSKFESDPTKSWIDKAETWWPHVTKVINLILSQVAASAAPFVSGAFDLAKGVKDTVSACYERYQTYSLGQGVTLNDGHPAVIVQSIERAMNFAIGKGLWDTLKGVTSITTSALAAGAGAIVSLVISGCEVIAKVVHRLWELSKMEAFFDDCADRYAKGKAGGAADDGLTHSGVAFGAWYRRAAVALPCISALALCSGVTGDKMMYLQMFQDEKDLKSAAIDPASPEFKQRADDFSRGVTYIDNLKAWSRSYLVAAGYRFHSEDKLVNAIAKASTESKVPPLTRIDTSIGRPNPLTSYIGSHDPNSLISLEEARRKFGGRAM
ncbi:MAG: hypothetical protein ACJ798_15465 [Phenylobacterium sp.]